ncbi:MAG: hypothetical protein D6710_01505, partial [Nitrospirae bacterium]
AEEQKYIILNFDNADISTVIATFSELLGINYILSPNISGKVTIQSYKRFPMKDLFSIFQTILEMNGLTAIRDGELYKIVPIDTARQVSRAVERGRDIKMVVDSSFITQIIPLEYVRGSDAANILRNLMPRGTNLIVYEPTNLLIVTARPPDLVKVMKILEAIDVPPSDRENIRTFVYYVENGEAKKLAQKLKEIYEKKGKTKTVRRTTTTTRRRIVPTRRRTTTTTAKPATSQIVGGVSAELSGEISITAYEDINAIIIKASPRDYLTILETLKKLDIPPKQVLIEVMIAEVTLDDSTKFGLEWLVKGSGGDITGIGGYSSSPGNLASSESSGKVVSFTFTPVFSEGAFVNILDPTKFNTLLSMSASKGNLHVLASPHILAVDNKEASIEIGDDIPIATGLTQQPATGGGATTLVSSGQIQYRTAGIILNVTPHISAKNKVTLKIKQEFSSSGGSELVAGQEFPKFIKRTAETTAIVQSGHTLVIGGLISDRNDRSRSGIPVLSNLPVLGYLFGSTTESSKRTELLLLVTPYVISDIDEADQITKQFQDRVKTITEDIFGGKKR